MIHKIICFFVLLSFHFSASSQPYPLPAKRDTTNFGENIQRSMKLLATSTPNHRNTVKIMVYGQSISKQVWSDSVKLYLTRKYPYANIIMINRSIGGFASPLLKKPMVHDIKTFYPDLVLFHVFGSHYDTDSIMLEIRSKTTAEVLLQNSHVSHPGVKEGDWETMYSYTHLPTIAKKYGLGFADVRTPWIKYLEDNHLKAYDCTSDGTHLNDQGNFLMAHIIEPYLEYKPKFPSDPEKTVLTYEVGKDIFWKNGKLNLPFVGNKIQIISKEGSQKEPTATLSIDGKKPSSFEGTYMFSRANDIFDYKWTHYAELDWPWERGGPVKITNQASLIKEDWVISISGWTQKDNKTDLSFDVIGSKTGFDGSGSLSYITGTSTGVTYSGETFISKSKRVVISSQDWWIGTAHKKTPFDIGSTFKFDVIAFNSDTYRAPLIIKDQSIDSVIVVAQGIPNEKHLFEIKSQSNKPVSIKAIRVYRPPFK